MLLKYRQYTAAPTLPVAASSDSINLDLVDVGGAAGSFSLFSEPLLPLRRRLTEPFSEL
jgi:hypothetical protein